MARVICPNCSNAYTPPATGPERCPRCGYGGEAPPTMATSPAWSTAGATTFTPQLSPPGPGFAPVGAQAMVPPTNGFAVASMVLGFVSIIPFIGSLLALLALVFGLVALNQIKKRGQRGFGMAVTGVVLGAIVLSLYVFFFFFVTAMF